MIYSIFIEMAKQMIVKNNNKSDALTIPLILSGCLIHFRHRMPTTDEISILSSTI
jgi:hypothetical protein